jgi:hypothetical protein
MNATSAVPLQPSRPAVRESFRRWLAVRLDGAIFHRHRPRIIRLQAAVDLHDLGDDVGAFQMLPPSDQREAWREHFGR